MIRVNLIPTARLERRRRHLRARRWMTACAAYAVFVLVTLVIAHTSGFENDEILRNNIVRTTAERDSTRLSVQRLRDELDEASLQLATNLAVGRQPDWSVLLTLLAPQPGDEIVLRHCRATRAPVAVGAGGNDYESSVLVVLEGLGASQSDVSRFVLRLEQLELFRSVKLLDTSREAFANRHVVAFRLECVIDPMPEDEEERS